MIESPRLLLVPFTLEHARAVLAGSRSDVWATDYPTEGDLVVAGLIDAGGVEAESPFGFMNIIERQTGLVVGGIGFKGQPADGDVEIGYGLAPSAQGRGLATEAVLAVVEFAFGSGLVQRVLAETSQGNRASQEVLLRAGFDMVSKRNGVLVFGCSAPRL
jgi:GNAT superfamily N-acetyltransferase